MTGNKENQKRRYKQSPEGQHDQEKTAEREALGLPQLPQLREEFRKLCEDLGG